MTTCGVNKGANARYMAGPNIEGCQPSTFLPSIATAENNYAPFDTYPNPRPLKRAQVTLPWKANSYYGVCKAEPSRACCESMPTPESNVNKLRYLDSIKIPPIFSSARNALNTRYSKRDWCLSNQCNYQSSNRVRCASEFLRNHSLRLASELEERNKQGQHDSSKKLGVRINDTKYWKCELQAEMDRMINEIEALLKSRNCLDREIKELNNTLYIDQEILYNREKRPGIELTHDEVEGKVIKEICLVKSVQHEMKILMEEIIAQTAVSRAALHELEKDSEDKYKALKIDNKAFSLNNTSRGIQFYDCVERVDNTLSVPETWAKFTDDNIKKSMGERKLSRDLRNKVREMLEVIAEKLITAWNEVNAALSNHVEEMHKTKYKLQAHLAKILEEIFEMEKTIEMLKRNIENKAPYMKVAQTRIEGRLHRPNMENTRDHAQNRITEEVYEVCETIDMLKAKLRETENALQQLLRTKTSLEQDLDNKLKSIYIDREKNLGLRKSYPLVSKTICY